LRRALFLRHYYEVIEPLFDLLVGGGWVNFDALDATGMAALHDSASSLRSAKLLLRRGGAEVDLLDATRRVPLHHACEDFWLDTRCIALFLEFMADPNRMDPHGLTPLELLEHRGFHCLRVWMKSRTLLVDKGARRTDLFLF
jgi:hypothetical protein